MESVSGSAKKKKHRRAKSNLESQTAVSTDQLLSEDDDAKAARARQRTKARFESFLQDAVVENGLQDSAKKKKKKKRTNTADSVLETIKSGSPIAKTSSKSEENLIAANLYKEDKSTPGKESKESYRTLLQETEENERTPRKSKNRTPSKPHTDDISTPESRTKSKRRKTKQTPNKTTNDESGKENLGFEEEQTTQAENETPTRRKKSPKRRGDKVRRKLQGDKTSKKTEEEMILSVNIHRTDQLKTDVQICHPMVRVHVVDITTGNYAKKSNRERNVASYYENKSESPVDYIMPVMTQPFDFKIQKCLIPCWEEVLIFNEELSHFLSTKETDPNIIIFFEVVDFLSMRASNRQRGQTDKGWYQIAWAFLKVVGGNGNINIDRKVRLQLFYPCKTTFRTKPANQLEIFHWWSQSRRVPYPSTLYVTLKGVTPPKTVEPALRSMYAIQQEKGRVTFEELTNDVERRAYGVRDNTDSDKEAPNWTKLPGQVNRIPNKQMLSLRSGRKGCFVVKFSHNGRYLACGCADADNFPVIVYEIPSGQCRGQLVGHFSIIYSLCWSADDTELISSSSDGTVRMWDIHSMMNDFIKVFPHPCFVYCAEYHPLLSSIIVTGGYDRLIRVWNSACDGNNGQLIREFEGHTGFINSVCFSHQGDKMFSGDSTGSIIIWQTVIDGGMNTKKKKKGKLEYIRTWTILKQVKEEELQGNVINSLEIHPSSFKLLVHTRNSAICMVDLRSSTVIKRYFGASNFKEHIHSTLSTCGSFVFSGSEDGVAYVWNVETGDVVSVYTSLNYENAVSDVDFHPMDNIIVFCSFGNSQPILVYKYDPKAAKVEAKRMMAPTTPIKAATPVTDSTDDIRTKEHLDDVTTDIMRIQRVKNKLNSVLETPGTVTHPLNTAMLQTPGDATHPFQTSYQTPLSAERGIHSIPETTAMRSYDTLSTWGSDFTPTMFTTPGQMTKGYAASPHSQQHLGSSGRFQSLQQFTQTPGSPAESPGSPMFHRTLGRDHYAKRGSLTMNITQDTPGPLRMSQLQHKPVFSFNAGSTIHEHPNQARNKVVAMYPYDANRADELTIRPGDVITVLYQDNDNWWMGELSNGSQGYFPSNYVMQQEELESESEVQEKTKSAMKPPTKKGTKMTAVTSKTGELRILSGPEDSSDPELSNTLSARQRRRQRKTESPEKTLRETSRGISDISPARTPRKRSPKKPSS